MYESSVKDVIKNYNSMGLGAEAFAEQTNLTDESLKSYFKTVQSGNATFTGYKSYVNSAATSTGLLGIKATITSGAMKALKVAMSTIGTMVLVYAVQSLITKLTSLHKSSEEIIEAAESARKKIDQLKESFESNKSSVDDLKDRYAKLAQGVDLLNNKNISLSTDDYEEFLSLSNQLADIFPQLTKGIDDNGNEILDLSGSVDTIVGSLDALIEKEQILINKQILEEMPDVYDGYKQKYDQYNEEIDLLERKQEAIQSLKNTEYSTNDSPVPDETILKWNLPTELDETSITDMKSALSTSLNEAGIDYNKFIIESFKDVDTGENVITLALPDVELENNNLQTVFGEYIADVSDKLQVARYKLENETSNFSKYMGVWLADQKQYQGQTTEAQNALEEMMFGGDWLKDAFADQDVDSSSWDSLAKWFEDNYIKAIDSINDKEIKNKLNQLFSINDAQLKIDLAKELQAYFEEKDIKISLGFILDENNYNSTQSIQNSFNQSLNDIAGDSIEDKAMLEGFVKNQGITSESQMNYWLQVTQGIKGANVAIKEYQKAISNSSQRYFFTEDNLENIDSYKETISNLSTYLKSINDNHKLSAEEMSILNTEYGIVANNIEGYKTKIIELMNKYASNSDVMEALKEAIDSCNDVVTKNRLQSLYDDLTNLNVEAQQSSDSFGRLDTAISSLQSKAETLRNVHNGINEIGYIKSSNLDDIISAYPELTDKVAEYNAGLISSQELFAELERCYDVDRGKYALLIADKLQYNEEFYANVVSNLPEWITKLAESYDIDFNNFKDLCEAKLELQKELVSKQASLDVARTIVDNLHDDDPSNDYMYMSEMDATNDKFDPSTNLVKSKKQVTDIEAIINGLNTALETNLDLDTSWQAFDNDTTKIDWIDQSLSVLQEAVDDAQTALDNTHGYEAQITAINTLNEALTKLKGGYEKAQGEYSDRYKEYLNQLPDGDVIRGYIESGTEFDLSQYDSDTATIIQNAIDAYNKMIEAEDKAAELGKQINDNNNIQKSKVRQEKYETKLSGIQTDLSNDTLTASEKNDLLKQQLNYQNKINKELIAQAEYEGRIIDAENLRKENKQNERDRVSEHWQNKIDENQNSIDAKNTLLESKDLTKSEINDINGEIKDLTKTDYTYKFKQIIKQLDVDNKWSDYINDLKKQYGQEDKSNKSFVKEHIQEIIEHFSYTGMEGLYYEFLNSMDDFEDDEFETNSTVRSYYINDNNNKIANIQSDIDYAGGRGTEKQYRDMQSLHQSSLGYWTTQKSEAEKFLKQQTEGTAGWDEWNAKLQEAQENIDACERSIKDCNVSILSLPLNDIEDELKDIENQLYTVNDQIDDYNTYVSAANFILDAQIREENQKKELLEDQVTALEKANDERNAELQLQKSLYNLEKLRNQKTEKVFKEDQGWVYESNIDDVKKAQEEYDNAVYNNKVTGLNVQIKEYDENIKKLNRIKDKWSVITTNAQGSVDLSKALNYDSDFFNKVLNGDTSLIDDIQTNMTGLVTSKDALEEEQEKYQELQDLINDTIEAYELEAISYELASQKISNSIKTYFPEIAEKYNFESGKLQEIIDKKATDAESTKTSTEKINENISESNRKLLENYTNFKDELGKVFESLNAMLQTYVDNTNTMVTSITTAVSQIQGQINSLASLNATVSITSGTPADGSSKDKNNGKKKETKSEGAIKNHKGLELGYVGESSISKDKEAFKYIALSELKDDEVVRLVQKGEAILNENQISQVMDNFRKVAQVKVPTLLPNNLQSNNSVNFNGDIIVQGVQNTDSLAKAIKTQLPQKMIQQFYSNK